MEKRNGYRREEAEDELGNETTEKKEEEMEEIEDATAMDTEDGTAVVENKANEENNGVQPMEE